MSRVVFLIIFALLVIGSFFAIKSLKESYPILQKEGQQDLASHNFDNWTPFTAPTRKFRIKLPHMPQRVTETISDPLSQEVHNYDMYVSEKLDGTQYLINSITFPENLTPQQQQEKLEDVKDKMLSANPSNRITSEKLGIFKTYPDIEFSIENDQTTIETVAFIVEKTLYILSSRSSRTNYNQAEFDFFSNSFTILDEEQELDEEFPLTPLPEIQR